MAFNLEIGWIREAEAALGRVLPPGYVGRMLGENGGFVKLDGQNWELHPIRDVSDRRRLKRTCNHLVLETRKSADFLPEGALVVGRNGGGDLLLLLPESPQAYGETVYWWDHETRQVSPLRLTLGPRPK